MEVKRRRPNWSEGELTALAEAIIPRSRILKAKFSPSVTTEKKNEAWREIAEQVNCTTMVSRTVEEMKKKWADIQSLTKKKESERRRLLTMTGGGPAPEIYFKEWEKLVLQTLSDVAIDGISGGVDTADLVNKASHVEEPVLPGLVVYEVPASELSQSAATPGPSSGTEVPLTAEVCEQHEKTSVKPSKRQQRDNEGQADEIDLFFNLEKEKMDSLEKYRERKLAIMEEMLELQRRSTLAMEQINETLRHGNSQPFSLSPVIKFS